jgi:hypothetical protein
MLPKLLGTYHINKASLALSSQAISRGYQFHCTNLITNAFDIS